jgi:predicted Fe-Mo cluster-binding NifX family protein
MKVAIESNDGVTIKSPFLRTKGYVVYDINESDIIGYEYRRSKTTEEKSREESVAAKDKLHSLFEDCSTIISRGMDRANLDVLKKEGINVFITFKTSAKDAVRLYMRELLIDSKFAH